MQKLRFMNLVNRRKLEIFSNWINYPEWLIPGFIFTYKSLICSFLIHLHLCYSSIFLSHNPWASLSSLPSFYPSCHPFFWLFPEARRREIAKGILIPFGLRLMTATRHGRSAAPKFVALRECLGIEIQVDFHYLFYNCNVSDHLEQKQVKKKLVVK